MSVFFLILRLLHLPSSGTPARSVMTNVLGQQMVLWLVCAPFIWDWRRSLSALRVAHFLRPGARRRTEKFASVEHWSFCRHPRSGFPFPLFYFLFSSLPGSRWRARSSVFRFGGETMKSLSPMAIAPSVGRFGRRSDASAAPLSAFISGSI